MSEGNAVMPADTIQVPSDTPALLPAPDQETA